MVPEEFTIAKVKAVAKLVHCSAFFLPHSSLAISCTNYRNKLFGQLDIGGSVQPNTWADSMCASSPTHAKASAALSNSVMAARDEEYEGWVRQHPSVLRRTKDIIAASKGRWITLFLDYDETILPIVDDPDLAFMSKAKMPWWWDQDYARIQLLANVNLKKTYVELVDDNKVHDVLFTSNQHMNAYDDRRRKQLNSKP
ncbi:hypothetical protein Cni_G06698 [Canna indica]|uniref:Uncharacterized protein n=1 Tax=Canna indica TaxID=4628 RepID=A0AAQ3Q675_9LILI|nr:hypothetical protein Cni_G06698 [Canna indica]